MVRIHPAVPEKSNSYFNNLAPSLTLRAHVGAHIFGDNLGSRLCCPISHQAVIVVDAHDTITLPNVTTAMLAAHSSDFHFF